MPSQTRSRILLLLLVLGVPAFASTISETSLNTTFIYNIDSGARRDTLTEDVGGSFTEVGFTYNVLAGTNPQLLFEDGVLFDLMVHTLPAQIMDANQAFNTSGIRGELAWTAVDVVLQGGGALINYTGRKDLTSIGILDLDSYVLLSLNRSEVDSANIPMLSGAALITFTGVNFTNPVILKDGVLCAPPECVILENTPGQIIFSVQGFTVYEAHESQTTTTTTLGPGPTVRPTTTILTTTILTTTVLATSTTSTSTTTTPSTSTTSTTSSSTLTTSTSTSAPTTTVPQTKDYGRQLVNYTIPATCLDGIQNGGETGVDCGGPCPPCQCFNEMLDGGEEDVDCGGPCPPCPEQEAGVQGFGRPSLDIIMPFYAVAGLKAKLQVVDDNSLGVLAQLEFKCPGAEPMNVWTDYQGYYAFNCPESGWFGVQAKRFGYNPKDKRLLVTPTITPFIIATASLLIPLIIAVTAYVWWTRRRRGVFVSSASLLKLLEAGVLDKYDKVFVLEEVYDDLAGKLSGVKVVAVGLTPELEKEAESIAQDLGVSSAWAKILAASKKVRVKSIILESSVEFGEFEGAKIQSIWDELQ